jgi:hypothetical protein
MEVIQCTLDRFKDSKASQTIIDKECTGVVTGDSQTHPVMLPITRSRRNATNGQESIIDTPAADSILGEPQVESTNRGKITSVIREGRIRWERRPREPLPQLDDVSEWVGKQLDHLNLPKKYQSVPPEGVLIPLAEDYMAPQATLLPHQHYGIDFYGIHKGEINTCDC